MVLQVVGLILVAVGLWIVHPAAFCLLAGAGLLAAPHVLAEPEPAEERVP